VPIITYWDEYPFVLRQEYPLFVYYPRPKALKFPYVEFFEISGNEFIAGLQFPFVLENDFVIDYKTLFEYALSIERPAVGFEETIEHIDFSEGLPFRAAQTRNGVPISLIEFKNGLQFIQRIDLDNDTRMETVRYLKKADFFSIDFNYEAEMSESDWNGDGLFEYGEEYLSDGLVVYSLDMDGSGIRNFSHIGDKKE
jgi:hypothetical protein